jgi:hypothetical protein
MTGAKRAEPADARTDPPTVRFYEAKEATEHNVCTITITTPGFLTIDFKHDNPYGCKNDEAESMKLHNMPPGSIITVYDDSGCADSDDWQRTRVFKRWPGVDIVIPSFQTDWAGPTDWVFPPPGMTLPPEFPSLSPSWPFPEYQVATSLKLHYDNGLNGKVSCATIDIPDAP